MLFVIAGAVDNLGAQDTTSKQETTSTSDQKQAQEAKQTQKTEKQTKVANEAPEIHPKHSSPSGLATGELVSNSRQFQTIQLLFVFSDVLEVLNYGVGVNAGSAVALAS